MNPFILFNIKYMVEQHQLMALTLLILKGNLTTYRWCDTILEVGFGQLRLLGYDRVDLRALPIDNLDHNVFVHC